MADVIEIDFSLSRIEYIKFSFQIIKRGDRIFYLFLLPVVIILCLITSIEKNISIDWSIYLLLTGLWLLLPFKRYDHASTTYKQYKGRLINQKYLIRKDTIRACYNEYCSILKWEEIDYCIDAKDFLAFIGLIEDSGKKKAVILPKNILTLTQQNILMSFIKEKPLYKSMPLPPPSQKDSNISLKKILKIILIGIGIFILFFIVMFLAFYFATKQFH